MVTHGEGVRIVWNLGTRAGSVDGTPRTALSQVGLLRHPPSENISGGTVRELDCTNDGGSVGEGWCLQDEVGDKGSQESRTQEYEYIYRCFISEY